MHTSRSSSASRCTHATQCHNGSSSFQNRHSTLTPAPPRCVRPSTRPHRFDTTISSSLPRVRLNNGTLIPHFARPYGCAPHSSHTSVISSQDGSTACMRIPKLRRGIGHVKCKTVSLRQLNLFPHNSFTAHITCAPTSSSSRRFVVSKTLTFRHRASVRSPFIE